MRGATHHVHEEQPAEVADQLLAFLGLRSVIGTPCSPKSPRAFKELKLLPPCPFVRGIDEHALQSFREGNLLYRMGSHKGSKGELCNLPRSPGRVAPLEMPSREGSESPV